MESLTLQVDVANKPRGFISGRISVRSIVFEPFWSEIGYEKSHILIRNKGFSAMEIFTFLR